jgi:Protein of unknown function (DUF3485)
MRNQKLLIFFITAGLIAATAGGLSWTRANQKLGQPGVYATPISGSVRMNIDLPEKVLDFTSTNVPEPQLVLNYLPPDSSYAERRYTAPDGLQVNTTIVLMGGDRSSIHKPDYCLPGQGWKIHKKSVVNIPVAGGQNYQLPVARWDISNSFTTPDGQKQAVGGLYVFWFVADGEQTTDNYERMWWLGRDGSLAAMGLYFVFFVLCPGTGGCNL